MSRWNKGVTVLYKLSDVENCCLEVQIFLKKLLVGKLYSSYSCTNKHAIVYIWGPKTTLLPNKTPSANVKTTSLSHINQLRAAKIPFLLIKNHSMYNVVNTSYAILTIMRSLEWFVACDKLQTKIKLLTHGGCQTHFIVGSIIKSYKKIRNQNQHQGK